MLFPDLRALRECYNGVVSSEQCAASGLPCLAPLPVSTKRDQAWAMLLPLVTIAVYVLICPVLNLVVVLIDWFIYFHELKQG